MRSLIDRLVSARIGRTTNFYREGPGAAVRRERLAAYLEARAGIPFTSERQLTGVGPAEATATIVHIAAAALGAEYVRHPSHGGLAAFRDGMLRFAPGGRLVRPFSV